MTKTVCLHFPGSVKQVVKKKKLNVIPPPTPSLKKTGGRESETVQEKKHSPPNTKRMYISVWVNNVTLESFESEREPLNSIKSFPK